MFDGQSMGVENQVTCLKGSDEHHLKQTRAKDFEAFAGKKLGFDATSPRFNYN